MKPFKIKQQCVLMWILTASMLSLSIINSQGQSKYVANTFVDADEVADTANGGANSWQNWFGTAYYNASWDSSDASNNPNSGSLKIESYFPDAGIGGQFGPQFFVINGFNGYVNGTYPQGIPGNGNPTLGVSVATNVQYDIRFEPSSAYDTNNNAWPWVTVGTRGTGFSQLAFADQYSSYSHDNTNWVHISRAIGVNQGWTNIPNIYFSHYDGTLGGAVTLYIDNIVFDLAPPTGAPTSVPSPAIQLAKPSLRLLSGPSQYNRIQVATVDTNQSWVGGSYPVSYSFAISGVDSTTSLNEFHVFLVPVNYNQGGLAAINQYTDYSSASNVVRLQVTGGAPGISTAFANISWKTNLINANPDHTILNITNNALVGTWTLTFSSATAGTLTAPGASPAAFNLESDVAATFANPLVAFFGVQPNPTDGIGQYVDLTQIQTAGVASPGVAISSLLDASGNVDTNAWQTTSVSADGTLLVTVKTNSSAWLNWSLPDYAAKVTTSASIGSGSVWKTPAYYNTASSNAILQWVVGTRSWMLLPKSAAPTLNSLSNGVPSANAFYRIQWPAPAE